MSRDALLKLSIRLSHLAETSDRELNKLLEKLRQSLRSGIDDAEINRISERLASRLLLNEESASKPAQAASLNDFAAEFARSIKALQVDKAQRSRLHKLADQLVANDRLDAQLQTLNEVFQVLRTVTGAAATKKSSSGGLLGGWLDKKGGGKEEAATHEELQSFMEKASRLLDQTLKHLDVLTGNSADTRALKEQLEQPPSVEILGQTVEDVITLLQMQSARLEDERNTTQNFLGTLRERLSTVEEAIVSVISGGDESIERAELLEQQVGEDVREIGQAVQADDINVLRQTVESGLSRLSSKVTDYLTVEKQSNESSKQQVEELNRKVRAMEVEARDLRGEIKDKQDLAVKDKLTGVYNRAGYEDRVSEEFARSKRSSSPLSLVFVDCNKFKHINDTFGHAAGDIVLVKVASTLAARARTSDIVARYGGDEFVAILPDTPADGAEHFARDACQKILDAGFNANGQPLDVSISCGITEVRPDDTPETALHRADEAMYLAKKATGHQVIVV